MSKGKKNKQEMQEAMSRLEDAAKDLGEAAKGNFADRAAEVLEQTAAKLKSEGSVQGGSAAKNQESNKSNKDDDIWWGPGKWGQGNWGQGNWGFDTATKQQPDGDGFSKDGGSMSHWQGSRAARPYRDLDNARLWGICAGTAPYLGLEVWVVRCIAVTCLVFMSQVIIPAYIIAYFVLDTRSELDDEVGSASSRRSRKLRKRRQRRLKSQGQERAQDRSLASDSPAKPGHRRRGAAAPTPPPASSVLRRVKGTLNEAELRLRRMEGHVTSGRYELQKELRKIDA